MLRCSRRSTRWPRNSRQPAARRAVSLTRSAKLGSPLLAGLSPFSAWSSAEIASRSLLNSRQLCSNDCTTVSVVLTFDVLGRVPESVRGRRLAGRIPRAAASPARPARTQDPLAQDRRFCERVVPLHFRWQHEWRSCSGRGRLLRRGPGSLQHGFTEEIALHKVNPQSRSSTASSRTRPLRRPSGC